MQKATIFDIERASYVDGPGIRTTVFFKGCNLRCAWCHNPESQRAEREMLFYQDKCTGCGKCKEKCAYSLRFCNFCGKCTIYCPHDAREICGKEYSVDEVLSQIIKDKAFFESSGGGVTFSGGECMLWIDFLEEMLKSCRAQGIHTAVDTAGCVPYSYFERILPYTDLFLYDIKCIDKKKHKEYTGVSNEQILENLAKLLDTGANVWVRIPIIPTVNDSEDDILAIREFLQKHRSAQKVKLLPYHAMGEHKYSALGREVSPFTIPSKEHIAHLFKLLNET